MKTKCGYWYFNKNKKPEVAKKEEKYTIILILVTDRSHPLINWTYHWLYIILEQFVDKLIVVVYSSRVLHVNKTDWQYTWPRYWKLVEIHLHKHNCHVLLSRCDATLCRLLERQEIFGELCCFLLQVPLCVLLYMPIPSADSHIIWVFIDKYTRRSIS